MPKTRPIEASTGALAPTVPQTNWNGPFNGISALSDLVDGEAVDSVTPSVCSTSNERIRSDNDESPTPSRNSSRTTNHVSSQGLSYAEQAEQAPPRPSRARPQIIKMPRVRDIKLRQNRTISWGTNHRHDAVLGQSRGEIAVAECHPCTSRQTGPFAACVVVPGVFGGVCCNCHYRGRGGCSFRQGMSLQKYVATINQ